MSIEDRLFALAQQYAGPHGAGALSDQASVISHLSSQAPDLHAEVRALAAAVSVDAANRIAAAGNADLEAQAIGGEIAASQKLAMASVMPAIAVVRRLAIAGELAAPAPTSAGAMPAPADAGWAGDSVVAGAPPPVAPVHPVAPVPAAAPQPGAAPPAPTAPDKPIWQNKWAIGGAAAVALVLAYQNFAKPGGPTPTPTATMGPTGPSVGPMSPNVPGAPAPAPTFNPQAPSQPTGLPELASPGGQLPTLLVRQQGQGFVVGFTLRGITAMVATPQGGWDRGPGMIALARNPRAQQPDSIGSGLFQRVSSSQGPSRLMRVQWQQDNLNAGPMCVAFVGAVGQDVNPSGSRLCVLDGGCSQAVACGQLPVANAQPSGGGMQPGQ